MFYSEIFNNTQKQHIFKKPQEITNKSYLRNLKVFSDLVHLNFMYIILQLAFSFNIRL